MQSCAFAHDILWTCKCCLTRLSVNARLSNWHITYWLCCDNRAKMHRIDRNPKKEVARGFANRLVQMRTDTPWSSHSAPLRSCTMTRSFSKMVYKILLVWKLFAFAHDKPASLKIDIFCEFDAILRKCAQYSLNEPTFRVARWCANGHDGA